MADDTTPEPDQADGPGDQPEVEHPEGSGEPGSAEAAIAASSFGNRERVVAGAAVLALLAGLGWLVLGGSEEPTPTTTTTAVSTTTEKTTTTEAETRPALVSQVATAKPELAEVVVWEAPPPEWDTMTPVVKWEAPEIPASSEEFSDRPDLPRMDYPLQGRYRTAAGWTFTNPTPFGDSFTALVTEQRGNWAEVMLPVRPNGTRGYLDLSQVDLSEHEYRVELTLSDRHLVVYKGTEVVTDTKVVVGKDSTRTPTGRFYITDKTDDVPSSFYGPHILPLNGYSEQLDTFDGGVPVIALHGTSRPDLLGEAASNGCVRLPNEVIEQLNTELPLGTQVEIYA